MREHDDYWQHDLAIGEARFWRDEYTARMRAHQETESYRGPIELIGRRSYAGERLYFHAKPYILLPDISLTVGLYDRSQSRNIGEVTGSTWEGMRHQEIGQAQAWYYAGEGLAVLWECYLEEAFRQEDPTADRALEVVWRGFERFLTEALPDIKWIITPSAEPIYPHNWEGFLRRMGYSQLNKRAFEKRP